MTTIDDRGFGFERDDRTTRSRARPAGRAADQARHLHQQGERDARPDARRHHRRRAGACRSTASPRFSLGLRRQPEPSRAGAALRLQRQLLPRAVGVVGRAPLADRAVHDGVRGDALAGVVRRPAARLGRRSGRHRGLPRAHRLHRRQRVAGAERLQRARRHLPAPESRTARASSTSATATSSP